MSTEHIIILSEAIVVIVLIYSVIKLFKLKNKTKKDFEDKEKKLEPYLPIVNLNDEINGLDKSISIKKNSIKQALTKINNLNVEIKDLETETKELNLELEFLDDGFYKNKYDFGLSEEYKAKLDEVLNEERELNKKNKCLIVEPYDTRDKKLNSLYLKSFNLECNVLFNKLSLTNFESVRNSLSKLYERMNKVGYYFNVKISYLFLTLKIEELKVKFEYNAKKKAESEEQKLIKEKIREDAKVEKEIEKVKTQAEKDENIYKRALEKARQEFSVDDKIIKELERKLLEAQENNKRAISRAQQTKSGHVYIISNVGSFGDNIFKIGMTRRIEPMNRVKELGDASVPFIFDVHGMIYSDNAPALEKSLHNQLNEKRVNMVNKRKEFFHTTISEINDLLIKNNLKIELTKLGEAREYNETLKIINNRNKIM